MGVLSDFCQLWKHLNGDNSKEVEVQRAIETAYEDGAISKEDYEELHNSIKAG